MASKVAQHRPPAMHAFKVRMKQNYDGQRLMLCIGAELDLGGKLDSHVILEHKTLYIPIFTNTGILQCM